MYVKLLGSLIVGNSLIWLLVNQFKTISKRERNSLVKLFTASFSAIVLFGTVSYVTLPEDEKKKYKSWHEYINNYNGSLLSYTFLKMILIGFISGMVFGIIDNTGLWFGMEAIDPILPKGTLTRAGYGNVYADTLSAFLSTFAGKIISNILNMNETPLWANAIGTTCGCLTGLHVCKAITGRI
tara:strand:- start:156 stop:704 length:549 start_codon:yes stop_codon:yes gene_type:complete